ncbi:type I-C CRISPR-associated protein Cas8c/Csd1 [Sporosarcina sp. GW1-11]|uniref:type I-C CRISPR-associated protein Cas8c/Csd1 n=1 Tax=Sporosarcina sp. GW1-11 TaxID=2899126 RepID=UPI00294C18CA|nr:type I-C CRISPR-associated protein Cas8c/Csd1 [Sporosarcina sp. GW1-11]MDV6378279.1 type I-C CRISPR-associated protein Cas8c/Csd1 [Sporosarcina sp. GW1-11]
MSWMKKLAEVYDYNDHQVGEFEERRKQRMTLLPVSHVMQSAQIAVLLTQDGEFHSAKVIDKENARTIVPATPNSANRSNSSAPHFIHDKLVYVAGDYVHYGGDVKFAEHHQHYKKQMKEWSESEAVSSKIQSVYQYISKGHLIKDLVDAKILYLDNGGKLLNKWPATAEGEKPEIYKVAPSEASAAFVRFDVLHETADDSVIWEDKDLFENFIVFLNATNEMENGICYITGEQTNLTTQHGSRIRNAGDMSKLISANDDAGFTYRGRFAKPTEAVQIGYEISQKAHHALRWLIQRQGTYVDSRYFITFGKEQTEILSQFDGTKELYASCGEDFVDIFAEDIEEQGKQLADTEELVAAELNKAIQGLRHTLSKEDLENVIVMALDAATKGRLAIVYYQELSIDLFLDAILHWHNTCKWLQTTKDPATNKMKTFIGTPSTYRLAEAVYGSKGDSRIKKDFYTRMLPCIVERKPLPNDIVSLIFNRVKNPFSFKNTMESWEATLQIACALINKQYESEGYTVAIQEENNSRDYLFGRLLGVAEVMERSVLKERDENRATNATRYFNAFSQHPARTWMVIRKQLSPYFQRPGSSTGYYAMLMQKIEDQLAVDQMTDAPLGPVFLLGYSSQIQEMYTKKGEKEHVSIEK